MENTFAAATKVLLVAASVNALLDPNELSEFRELAISTGADIQDLISIKLRDITPKYYIGSGKALEIAQLVETHDVSLVIFNNPLTPIQERNLEKLIKCRVIDRVSLILDIFARRARTFEGKLQVELAQLKHLSTRLVRGWTHLERQKGGIGLRGPGETQLEVDRRLINDRIKALLERLEKVRQQRAQGRQARQQANIPVLSLVGYTNAGKSTLFNAVTRGEVLSADQLFATLDPTFRRMLLPHGQAVILADTVGFIRDLPHDLVEAFRATLEEVAQADCLLHVIDAASPERKEHIAQVKKVLAELGVKDVPVLEIYNKVDLIEAAEEHIDYGEDELPVRVWISSAKEQGLDLLMQAIAHKLYGKSIERQISLQPTQGQLRAKLYEMKVVRSESIDDEGNWQLLVRMPLVEFDRLSEQLAQQATQDR